MAFLTCVDIGNHNIKYAVFDENGTLISNKVQPNIESIRIINSLAEENNVILSDVSGITDNVSFHESVSRVDSNFKFPFNPEYEPISTLGSDRLCGIAGAILKKPNSNCLVFNLGTCLTIDFIDKDGNYKGGNISPGLKMRFKSLNKFTAKLPRVETHEETSLIGNSTETAISYGVQNGLLAEIEYYLQQFLNKTDSLNVFVTGGDAEHFINNIKSDIIADPFLTLYGLFNIGKFNGLI